ncbi:helix-turn-helix domain-containing protein [Rhodococcus kroppenstedtii]|uniref:MerR family transcriptional regulator, heat shock protein HspR n=2 Tax=Rhodococcoides kroppenstedtii TaxID=293050 RepID=A0A1I0TNZ2_9NOCA|nr:helix-turn-helix domain-containing protein [Rhodococcus kroppenstedtii]AMY20393.1 Putative heat shock protein HspR [Rhodococcus sp. PBTS 1]MDV7197187.1 helix-turn-helix domain-containing protein [Rhodococcus kroppenstedtii]NIL81066.1 putative heat shock protein HspR [Rhodococcus kroppenstedtii]SFA53470.1 MerR family transcriptional regulator, heat shock protein HspR [Rhodococcus kroppenstedtii]
MMADDASTSRAARGVRADGGPADAAADPDARIFVISVAAELAGMHAQTLRTYDRLGLVTPHRTTGGGRRYSPRDVALLREVQRLSQDEGVNLAGIKRIIELTNQVEALQSRISEMAAELAQLHAGMRRDLVPVQRSNALVVWQPRSRKQ